jgi:uncharacterized protein YecT (DUF1311 family)
MKSILKLCLLVTLPLFLTACFDSAEVKQVKGGVMQMCPNHTVDQMVKGFMGSPSWKSGKSDSGKVFVNVEGDITFHDKPVRAMVQFIVEGERFSFGAFEMNGVPSANLIAIGMLGKMCESAEGGLPEKTAEKESAPQNNNQTLAQYNQENTVPVPTAAEPVPAIPVSSVEQTGVCKGLNMEDTNDQVECLNRKFSQADLQLNDSYKQLMAGFDGTRKAELKKEQITWIKLKEAKCAQAGKEVEGGTMELVVIADCKVQETEQRLAYLKNYK